MCKVIRKKKQSHHRVTFRLAATLSSSIGQFNLDRIITSGHSSSETLRESLIRLELSPYALVFGSISIKASDTCEEDQSEGKK